MSDKEQKPLQDDHHQSKSDNEENLSPDQVDNSHQESGLKASTGSNTDQEEPAPPSEECVDHDRPGEVQSSEHKDYALTEQNVESSRNHSDSPDSLLLSVSGSSSELEGAVGGQAVEVRNGAPRKYNEFPRRLPGFGNKHFKLEKLPLFQKYFDQNFGVGTLPQSRTRHNADRHRRQSDGSIPRSNNRFSNENPLGHLQVSDFGPEPLLNQAGAIVGIRSRTPTGYRYVLESGNNGGLVGFDSGTEAEHSLGSAETVPIGEIYSGNFSPARASSDPSSRGVSPGSFPSFSSRPQTSSDYYDLRMSPISRCDSPVCGERRISPESTDSENQPAAEASHTRSKRLAGSRPIPIPSRGDSELAGSEGSHSDERGARSTSRKSTAGATAECSSSGKNGNAGDSTESSEMASSSDMHSEEDAIYPELCLSVESDDVQPMPDLVPGIANEVIDQVVENPDSSGGTSSEPLQFPGDEQQVSESSTDDSTEEPDPVSVLSLGSRNGDNQHSDES